MRPIERTALCAALWILLLTGSASVQDHRTYTTASGEGLNSLHDAHRWLELRDALQKVKGPALYRGVVAAALIDRSEVEKILRGVIKSAPRSEQASEAYEALAHLYIQTGPYRLSRNPIYLSFTLLELGIGILVNSAWVLGMLIPTVAFISYGVIAREEEYMAAKFGEEYRGYKTDVRRWI